MVDFDNEFEEITYKQSLTYEDMARRANFFQQQIIAFTKDAHDAFLEELEKMEVVADIFRDPVGCQMWHHKFLPHENVLIKEVPVAQLPPYPAHMISHNTQSIKNFMNSVSRPSSAFNRLGSFPSFGIQDISEKQCLDSKEAPSQIKYPVHLADMGYIYKQSQ